MKTKHLFWLFTCFAIFSIVLADDEQAYKDFIKKYRKNKNDKSK
jgi:hypothetical protein